MTNTIVNFFLPTKQKNSRPQLLAKEHEKLEDQLYTVLTEKQLSIHKSIGKGTQGEVYLLADRVSKNPVKLVLKIRPPAGKYDTTYEPTRGPHLVQSMQHPSINSPIEIYYFDKNKKLSKEPKEGSACIATIMPYVEGDLLKGEKFKEISLYAERIFLFGLQITDAVNCLMKSKIAHNDLHMENIMVDNLLKPKIIDFGWCGHIDRRDLLWGPEDRAWIAIILEDLIKHSTDIAKGAKEFLLSCLDVWINSGKDLTLMESFMHTCIYHLREMRSNPTQLPSRL